MVLNGYVLNVDLALAREMVSLQHRCANNLNQVAIHANTYGVYPSEIAALQKDYMNYGGPGFRGTQTAYGDSGAIRKAGSVGIKRRSLTLLSVTWVNMIQSY